MPRAFTRAVSPKLFECELTHLQRVPIDPRLAAAQHDDYERALEAAGYNVIRLPDQPEHADGVFVEDTALLLDTHAVILRPGAASRAPEAASTADGLAGQFELHRVEQGHVDGGDVLRIDNTLYVGLSTRTDADGIGALRNLVRPIGFDVVQAQLKNCLHLKSGATLAGRDQSGSMILIYNRDSIDPEQFAGVEAMPVHESEPNAANCLRLNDRLILPAGYPHTADQLRARGLQVIEIDVSELQKAEAGVTCMSLISN